MPTTSEKPGKSPYRCTKCGQRVVLDDRTDTLPPCPRHRTPYWPAMPAHLCGQCSGHRAVAEPRPKNGRVLAPCGSQPGVVLAALADRRSGANLRGCSSTA